MQTGRRTVLPSVHSHDRTKMTPSMLPSAYIRPPKASQGHGSAQADTPRRGRSAAAPRRQPLALQRVPTGSPQSATTLLHRTPAHPLAARIASPCRARSRSPPQRRLAARLAPRRRRRTDWFARCAAKRRAAARPSRRQGGCSLRARSCCWCGACEMCAAGVVPA